MGEKTEKATPKKLRDARKKGQVAKSQDLPSAFTFVVSISVVLAMAGWYYNQLGGFTVNLFSLIPYPNLTDSLGALYMHAIMTIFNLSIPVLAATAIIGVIINFLAVGPVFSIEVFKPDIKKFNPVTNLKQKFKLKTLIELIKSLIKVFIAAYLIYGVMYKSLPVLTQTVSMPMVHTLVLFQAFLMEVLIKVGLFFLIVAILDFAYQKYNFGKEMMMEKFEIKQEYKNTEGDPQIKGKRRQIAQEIAYSEGPAGGVKRAAAVVTNPTHLAIAIGYERGVDAAPYVTVKGKDHTAELIIRVAKENNIPIIRNIRLAHRLWEGANEYEFVPEDTYQALAEILRWVANLGSENEYDLDIKED